MNYHLHNMHESNPKPRSFYVTDPSILIIKKTPTHFHQVPLKYCLKGYIFLHILS